MTKAGSATTQSAGGIGAGPPGPGQLPCVYCQWLRAAGDIITGGAFEVITAQAAEHFAGNPTFDVAQRTGMRVTAVASFPVIGLAGPAALYLHHRDAVQREVELAIAEPRSSVLHRFSCRRVRGRRHSGMARERRLTAEPGDYGRFSNNFGCGQRCTAPQTQQ